MDQGAEINVNGSSKAVPARKALLLLALEIPQRIADVLEIECDTSFLKARPHPAPISEQMAVRALPRLMVVRAAKRFRPAGLGKDRTRKNEQRKPG
jgi:hypothetical protein